VWGMVVRYPPEITSRLTPANLAVETLM